MIIFNSKILNKKLSFFTFGCLFFLSNKVDQTSSMHHTFSDMIKYHKDHTNVLEAENKFFIHKYDKRELNMRLKVKLFTSYLKA